MKHLPTFLVACIAAATLGATPRETIDFDRDWYFAFGSAASPEQDFGNATEYFTYLTKAASIHNAGP